MVLVSYFSVLIGLSFSHIGYYLNVFDGLWKIGPPQAATTKYQLGSTKNDFGDTEGVMKQLLVTEEV